MCLYLFRYSSIDDIIHEPQWCRCFALLYTREKTLGSHAQDTGMLTDVWSS